MSSTRTLVATVAVASLMIVAVAIAFGQSYFPATSEVTPSRPGVNFVFVGSTTWLAGQTLVELRERTGGPVTEVSELATLPEAAGKVNSAFVVIFDSEWLVGRANEIALLDFLAVVLPTEAKVVATGGSTSLLFEALWQVQDDIFAEGRNPAWDNPPLAGYKLKRATAPDGTVYYGDSILIGYPETASSAAEAILDWG